MHIFNKWPPAMVVWLLGIASLSALPVNAAQELSTGTPPDPALRELVRESENENPGVQAARAAMDVGMARSEAASRPLYNPELELDAENADDNTVFVGIGQTIDWSNKRGARRQAAGSEQDALRAEFEVVRQEIAGELLTALGSYHSAVSGQELAKRRSDLMQRFTDLADKRWQAGDINQVELDLARLASTQAQLQEARAAADVVAAEQALAAVLGERRMRWPDLPEDLPAIDDFDVDVLLADLPIMRAKRARVAAMRNTVTLRDRERRADPTISVRGGREDLEGSKEETLVGINLSIPLFVRNNFRAEVAAANAELIRAEREGQDLHRRTRSRLLSAAERYRLSRGAWAIWQRTGQPSIDRQVNLLERAWRVGELSTTDYLVQIDQTLDTRAEALAVRSRLWESWFDWLVASALIDQWLAGDTPR